MSIHFISGKPGGGKTLYGVRMIMDELSCGVRPIITNVPLRLAELNRYFQEHYPKSYERRFFRKDEAGNVVPVHITDIIRVLSDDEMGVFFSFRGNDVRLPTVTNVEWRAGKRPDYSSVEDGGVFYVLDEVHIAFNARKWAETGNEVLYYLSQHRKLGDDVVCITQAISNVDKQFRSVAQDFTYIKNLSKQNLGLFRMPALFLRSTYAQPAVENSKAMETGSFSLDVSGMAACYDTAKGVGIHGRRGADTKARKRGIHWLWFLIGLPVFLYCVYHFVPHLVAKCLFPGVPAVHQRVSPASQRPASASAGVGGVSEYQLKAEDAATGNVANVFCTGYGILPVNRVYVALSDGRVARSEDGEVQKVGKQYVWVFGEKFPVHEIRDSELIHTWPEPEQNEFRMVGSSPVRTSGVDVTVIRDSRRSSSPVVPAGSQSLSQKMAENPDTMTR